MNDEYPEIPNRFIAALSFQALDEDQVIEIWQSLCDEFGSTYAGQFSIEITCPDTRGEDDYDEDDANSGDADDE